MNKECEDKLGKCQSEYNQLDANHKALVADVDMIVANNQRLRRERDSLDEMLKKILNEREDKSTSNQGKSALRRLASKLFGN